MLWAHQVFSQCCLCAGREQREELPALITPTICWTPKRTLSPHLPPPLCLSLTDTVYLPISSPLPLYLITRSVFSLCGFFLSFPSFYFPLVYSVYFLTIHSLLVFSERAREQGGSAFGKEDRKNNNNKTGIWRHFLVYMHGQTWTSEKLIMTSALYYLYYLECVCFYACVNYVVFCLLRTPDNPGTPTTIIHPICNILRLHLSRWIYVSVCMYK